MKLVILIILLGLSLGAKSQSIAPQVMKRDGTSNYFIVGDIYTNGKAVAYENTYGEDIVILKFNKREMTFKLSKNISSEYKRVYIGKGYTITIETDKKRDFVAMDWESKGTLIINYRGENKIIKGLLFFQASAGSL